MLRHDLVYRLQRGEGAGPLTAAVFSMPASMLQWQLVERALAATHANYQKGDEPDGEFVKLRVGGPGPVKPTTPPGPPEKHPSKNKVGGNPFAGLKDV